MYNPFQLVDRQNGEAERIQGINRGGVRPQGNLAGRQAREGEVDGAVGG